MTTSPVRFDRLQAGLRASLLAAYPDATVVWSPSEFPRAAAGPLMIAIKLIAGPTSRPLGGSWSTVRRLPTAATLRVLPAVQSAVGEAVSFRASGWSWEYVIQPGDDESAVRDGLLAEVGVEPMVSAAFVAVAADSATITPAEVGDLYDVAARGSTPGLVEVSETTALAAVHVAEVSSRVEVQAYSTDRYVRSGAAGALTRWAASLRLPLQRRIWDVHGLSTAESVGSPVNLDRMSGPNWESRAAIGFEVQQLSVSAEPAETIDNIRLSLSTRSQSGDESVAATTIGIS